MGLIARRAKSFASLNAGMLGRSDAVRRVPLSFAAVEKEADDIAEAVEVPEVVRRVERLALALGLEIDAPVTTDAPIEVVPPARTRRVAFTLRIDPVRHARLRQIVSTEGRSAQQVLIDAMDQYCAQFAAAHLSHTQASTGNEP